MKLTKLLFLSLLILCGLVSVMIIQTLYLQAEGSSIKSEGSSFSWFRESFRYYLFLPRMKLQLFIRSLRGRLKSTDTVNSSEQLKRSREISQLFADVLKKSDYVQYIVFVISTPSKRQIRDLLRTEGYWSYNWTDSDGTPIDWKHFFVVGQTESPEVNKAVLEESKECGDILIGDFSDSYKNLVFKSLWLIEWAANRYDFDSIIKCDDDTIINLSKYHELMKQQDLSKPFYGGVRFGAMQVFRNGRYEVSKTAWEPDKFPPYCSGGGYTLNKLAIQKMLEVHYSGDQELFLVEDAYMGVLSYRAKVEVTALNGPFKAFSPDGACNNPEIALMHYVKNEKQSEYMTTYREIQRFCDDQHAEQFNLEQKRKKAEKKKREAEKKKKMEQEIHH